MTDPDGEDRDLAILRGHAAQLMEHFDSVQIFVTRHKGEGDGNNTIACNVGLGNWYARIGQIREWIIQEDERIREHHRKSEDDE